jgi:hypothetical protein
VDIGNSLSVRRGFLLLFAARDGVVESRHPCGKLLRLQQVHIPFAGPTCGDVGAGSLLYSYNLKDAVAAQKSQYSEPRRGLRKLLCRKMPIEAKGRDRSRPER